MKDYGEFGKKLPVDRIKSGYQLLEDVRSKTGDRLFKAGDIVCDDDIRTMMHSDVKFVWVYRTEDMHPGDGYLELNLAADSGTQNNDTAFNPGILLVDDVESVRKNLSGIFERQGFTGEGKIYREAAAGCVKTGAENCAPRPVDQALVDQFVERLLSFIKYGHD
jgi:hypothetical protein